MFDVYYFLRSPYASDINYDIIKQHTGKEAKDFYVELQGFIRSIQPTSVLSGMGELLTPVQKVWAKAKLIEELTGLVQRQIDVLH